MKRPHPNKRGLLALLMALLFGATLLTSCGSDDDGDDAAAEDDASASEAAEDEEAAEPTEAADDEEEAAAEGDAEPVTIEWWHIQNNDPGLSLWQAMADEFTEMNPHVTFDIQVLENDTFKPTIETRLQADDPPDLFQSWGGGDLRAQVEAGLVQDVTDATSGFVGNLNQAGVDLYKVDGAQYAIPFDMGMVGFWYNTELFAEAGIEETPTTWDEFLDTVQQLKDAGITPLAVGAGAQWPAHFYYAYMLLRMGGPDAMDQLNLDGDFSQPAFIEAGEELQRLLDLEPFQPGYLAAPWPGPDGEAGTMATSQAAMDLMGQWAPNEFNNSTADGEDIAFELGWFPFPEVEGGAGAPTDIVGGANGFAVGRDAPPEVAEFLEYVTLVEQANRWGEAGLYPVTAGSEGSVTDPNGQMVVAGLSEATYFQLFLDQLFPQETADTVNAEVQRFFGGETTPDELGENITAVAQSG